MTTIFIVTPQILQHHLLHYIPAGPQRLTRFFADVSLIRNIECDDKQMHLP